MMRKQAFFLLAMALLAASPCLLLLGCGGCSSTKAVKTENDSAKPSVWQLSEGAQQIYAQLALSQAAQQQDIPLLLESIALLEKGKPTAASYGEAATALADANTPEALDVIKRGLALYPEDALLNLLFGEYLLRHNAVAEGTAHMNQYILRHPENKEARLELALVLNKNERFAEAENILRALAAKDRTPFVELQYAKALAGMGKQEQAIQHLHKALKAAPEYVEAMAELATLYDKQGQWQQARSMYEKIRDTGTGTPALFLRLVQISLLLREPEKALSYAAALENDTAFSLRVAGLLLENGYMPQAEQVLATVAGHADAPREIFLDLARIAYLERHNPQESLRWLEKVPQGTKEYEEALLLHLQVLFDLDQKNQALALAQKHFETYPQAGSLREAAIRILAALDRKPEALALARKAAQQWADNVPLQVLLGTLLDDAGDQQAALTHMEKVLTLSPNNVQALNYIGYTLAVQGRDLDRALDLLEKAVSLAPQKGYIWDSLAWAQFKAKKHTAAWVSIQRSVKEGGADEAEIWEHYGDIALALGKKDDARKAYQQARELNPANAAALDAKLSAL